jgi:colanic acid biosynthesis glycosyl transferase WcaI
MRILFFADNFRPERNAQASRVFERARYWVKWGHQVTVVTCAPNFPEGRVFPKYRNAWHWEEYLDGIRVVRVKTFITPNQGVVRRMLDYLSFLPTAFWAGLREESPDVIAATSPQMFAALAAWAVALLKRRPWVLEVSDLWPESVLAVGAMRRPNVIIFALDRVMQFLYNRASRIVVLTNAFKQKIVERGVGSEKIRAVLNGADLSVYQPRERDASLARGLRLPADAFVIGYIGTLGMAHGLEAVLEAAERLRDTRVRFLLVGPGAERERLVTLARARSLDNVVFVSPRPKQEMPAYWSLCNMALVHLKDEPLFATVIPSKLFEAVAMGLPILLVAPKGEASRLVESEGIGIHVPPGYPAALAQVIELLMESNECLETLANRCVQMAPRHSREEQARLYLKVLSRACAVSSWSTESFQRASSQSLRT